MYRLILILFGCLLAQKTTAQVDSLLSRRLLDRTDLAQGQASSEVQLVSASRSGKSLLDLPVTAYVITKEEIQRNGYTSLTDVLKSVPGIRISRPGSGQLGEMFMMRGMVGNEYTKILINSVPIQPSDVGGISLGEQLPIVQAEAIEIIYGPAASVYGADAMAGVINIITSTPQNSSLMVEGSIIHGNYGYTHSNFLLGSKLGRNKNVLEYTVYGNVGKRRTWDVAQHGRPAFDVLEDASLLIFPLPLRDTLRNFALNNPEMFVENYYKNPETMPYYQGTLQDPKINELPHNSVMLGGTIKYRGFRADWHQMYRRDHANLGLSALTFSYFDPNSYIGDMIQRFHVGYTKELKNFSIVSNLSYLRHRADFGSYSATNYEANNNGKSYVFFASDDIFGELLATYTPSKNWELTAGVAHTESSVFPRTEVRSEPFESGFYRPFTNQTPPPDPFLGTFGFYPQRFRTTGAFLQGFFTNKRWTITSGLRWEFPSHYEVPSNFFSRLAVLYKISDKLSARGMVGGAFKAPSPNTAYGAIARPESDVPGISDSIIYELVPNPDLAPEVLSSGEIGLRYRHSNHWYFELATYFVSIDNLITNTFIPIDQERYPLADMTSSVNGIVPPGFTRSPVNDDNSESALFGLQFIVRGQRLWKPLNLDTDIYLTLSSGQEQLPEDRGTLNAYRQVPSWLIKWNIDLVPFKRAYVRMEHTFSNGWYSRFIPSENILDRPESFTDGFYNMDLLLSYKLGRFVNAFVKIRNLFDAKYGGIDARGADVDLDYNPQVGRNIHFGITFRKD